jgi:pyruvate kinase
MWPTRYWMARMLSCYRRSRLPGNIRWKRLKRWPGFALEAEKEYLVNHRPADGQISSPATIEEAIARATMFTASGLQIRAIAALTQSGVTALLMSRRSSKVPIFALSPNAETRSKGDTCSEVFIRWSSAQG